MILYCVRHGETTFNAQGRIQGQLDTPLSETGRRQAEALAAALAEVPIEAIYSSPLSRALDTASAIAQRLRLPVRTDDRLMEIHAGVFQGLLRTEMAEHHPAAAERWFSRDPDFQIPGGESRRDLMRRGGEVLRAVRAAGHAQAIVVSHGGLLSAALKDILGVPADKHPFHFYNAAFCRLLWEHDVVLDTFNQCEHLRAIGYRGLGDL